MQEQTAQAWTPSSSWEVSMAASLMVSISDSFKMPRCSRTFAESTMHGPHMQCQASPCSLPRQSLQLQPSLLLMSIWQTITQQLPEVLCVSMGNTEVDLLLFSHQCFSNCQGCPAAVRSAGLAWQLDDRNGRIAGTAEYTEYVYAYPAMAYAAPLAC